MISHREVQRRQTYAVQQNGHVALVVERGLVTAQLGHLADEHDDAAVEALEVRRGDARGGELLGHFRGRRAVDLKVMVMTVESRERG